MPQPQVKRHDGVAQIVVEPPAGFQEHFLHHVARIHPRRDGGIEPQPDHAPHGLAVLCQQLLDRGGVTVPGLVKECLRFRTVRFHQGMIHEGTRRNRVVHLFQVSGQMASLSVYQNSRKESPKPIGFLIHRSVDAVRAATARERRCPLPGGRGSDTANRIVYEVAQGPLMLEVTCPGVLPAGCCR